MAIIYYTKDRLNTRGICAASSIIVSVDDVIKYLGKCKFEYNENIIEKHNTPEDRPDLTDFVEFKRVTLEISDDDKEKISPFFDIGFYHFTDLSPKECLKIFPLTPEIST